MWSIMSSANSDSFTFSLPVWIPFTPFSCLMAVARTSNTMLNRSSKTIKLLEENIGKNILGHKSWQYFLRSDSQGKRNQSKNKQVGPNQA